MISDSQTVLSLCSRPSSTLDLSTSLVVSRVQEVFTTDRLYFAPGATFSQSVDLLTRYRPHLQTLISEEFYRPSWLLPEIADRVTVRVEHMRKQPEETLPHLCAQQQVWALMQGSRLGANRLTKEPFSTQTLTGFHSTGSWGLMRKEKCLPVQEGGATCLMCNTAPAKEVSVQDAALLKTAKEKQVKKTSKMKKRKQENKLSEKVCSPREVSILSFAALSSFKMSKKRKIALSARSGLKDPRPPNQDTNIWSKLSCPRS